jgi:hypothetical protein
MRNDMQITNVSRAEKIIRKAGSVAVVLLFLLDEGLHIGNKLYFWLPGLVVAVALYGFIRAQIFSRTENLYGIFFLASGVASKIFFHAGDGTFELVIPWFIIMYLWYGVRVCSPERSRQIQEEQPQDFDERNHGNFEYRPGPDGTSGYYQDGKPIKFD